MAAAGQLAGVVPVGCAVVALGLRADLGLGSR